MLVERYVRQRRRPLLVVLMASVNVGLPLVLVRYPLRWIGRRRGVGFGRIGGGVRVGRRDGVLVERWSVVLTQEVEEEVPAVPCGRAAQHQEIATQHQPSQQTLDRRAGGPLGERASSRLVRACHSVPGSRTTLGEGNAVRYRCYSATLSDTIREASLMGRAERSRRAMPEGSSSGM